MTEPPLLALAAGKKVRLRRISDPPEKELPLHISIVHLLKVAANPKWRWTHIPNGELRDIRTAQKLKAMGVQPGWPDMMFVGPRSGQTIQGSQIAFLEFKRKDRSLSETQRNFRDWCIDMHIPFEVTDNANDAIRFLQQHEIIIIRK